MTNSNVEQRFYLVGCPTAWGERSPVYIFSENRAVSIDRWTRELDYFSPRSYLNILTPCTPEDIIAQTPDEHKLGMQDWIECLTVPEETLTELAAGFYTCPFRAGSIIYSDGRNSSRVEVITPWGEVHAMYLLKDDVSDFTPIDYEEALRIVKDKEMLDCFVGETWRRNTSIFQCAETGMYREVRYLD